MMTPDAIRVLLVDDQALLRAGFRTILESEPGIVVVGEASDGQSAIDQARLLGPDVICMDVQMPGMDGLAATEVIVADPDIRAAVLVLTTFDREDYLFEALKHGASGFILKNSTPEALIEAVQVLASGNALLAPDVTRRVIERFTGSFGAPERMAPGQPAPERTTQPIPTPRTAPESLDQLTDREAEVLSLLALGLANSEIAGRLHLGEATVKTHVSKVLMKLGLRDRIQAVVFAYEHGLVVPGQPA
jgi:DNA-binding NarL/FixJ family response regulator